MEHFSQKQRRIYAFGTCVSNSGRFDAGVGCRGPSPTTEQTGPVFTTDNNNSQVIRLNQTLEMAELRQLPRLQELLKVRQVE